MLIAAAAGGGGDGHGGGGTVGGCSAAKWRWWNKVLDAKLSSRPLGAERLIIERTGALQCCCFC